MHAAVVAAEAKSDILFRPRAKVMREREREREEEGETESGGSGGRKLVCFAATIYVSASAKGGEEKEGRKEGRKRESWRLYLCGELLPASFHPSLHSHESNLRFSLSNRDSGSKIHFDTCVCG